MMNTAGIHFDAKPILVFWEVTRACMLSCVHCRAAAITKPLPGELTRQEGFRLIDQVASFDKPYPTIIFTGGDPLERKDLFELLEYASGLGMSFAVSPAVTSILTHHVLKRMREAGVSSISISLDGASAETHDAIRGLKGTYDRTIETIRDAIGLGLKLQVNTAIMRRNFQQLPGIFHLIRSLGVETWELFFLIRTGRGLQVEDLSAEEHESVCNFLYDASHYGLTIRCVEAPFIRRVTKRRMEEDGYGDDDTYLRLRENLLRLEGDPLSKSTIRLRGTLDGDGIIFVSYDGTIFPGGLLPIGLGNIRGDSLPEVYRNNELLKRIRKRSLRGQCGQCDFRDMCGGSRARAYSYSGDPLASDPACFYGVHHGRLMEESEA